MWIFEKIFGQIFREDWNIYSSIWSYIWIPNLNSPICPDAHTSETPRPAIMLIAAYLILLMLMLATMKEYFKKVISEPAHFPTGCRLGQFKRPNSKMGGLCVCVWSYLLVTAADTGGRWPITAASQITQRSKLPELRMSAGGPWPAQLRNQGEPTKPCLASSSPPSRLSNT